MIVFTEWVAGRVRERIHAPTVGITSGATTLQGHHTTTPTITATLTANGDAVGMLTHMAALVDAVDEVQVGVADCPTLMSDECARLATDVAREFGLFEVVVYPSDYDRVEYYRAEGEDYTTGDIAPDTIPTIAQQPGNPRFYIPTGALPALGVEVG